MSKITIKKSFITLVACLMLALVVFSACSGDNAFEPTVDLLSGQTVSSNGGIAVKYGEYIYYVNGYQGTNSAENDYTNDIRTGSIVRIKLADIQGIIDINDEDISSSDKTERIAAAVKDKVDLIVPCFYYSANTTNTSLTGLYIFDDRIYITTPNQALTDGGNTQFDQAVLTSFALDGSDKKEHYTFSSSSLQIMLTKVGETLCAIYLDGTTLNKLDVATGNVVAVAEEISSAKFDSKMNAVYYLDEEGQICEYIAGGESGNVLKAKTEGTESEHLTYTISSVANGYVYYTQTNSENGTMDGKITYYVTNADGGAIGGKLLLASISSYVTWGDKAIYTTNETLGSTSITQYTVWYASVDNDGQTSKVELFKSDDAVTLNKVEGNTLYYTSNSTSYTCDLNNVNGEHVAYAKSLSTTAQGWAMPEIIDNYVFSLTSGGLVNVMHYDAVANTNSASTDITLVADEEDAE